MPIRSNRGRAAVYRKLWGWPMRSPKHLAISAFFAALVIAAAGIIVPKVVGKTPTQTTAGASQRPGTASGSIQGPGDGPSRGSSPTTSLPTRLTSAPAPSSAPAAPAALAIAKEWAEAWVFHPVGTTTDQWLDRLRPLTTEEYLGVMASVDPANIVAKEVTGPAEPVSSYEKSVIADVPTDDIKLRVTVIHTDQGWRVANYEREA